MPASVETCSHGPNTVMQAEPPSHARLHGIERADCRAAVVRITLPCTCNTRLLTHPPDLPLQHTFLHARPSLIPTLSPPTHVLRPCIVGPENRRELGTATVTATAARKSTACLHFLSPACTRSGTS